MKQTSASIGWFGSKFGKKVSIYEGELVQDNTSQFDTGNLSKINYRYEKNDEEKG